MEKKRRTIIIGLDGATWTFLKPWAEKGELPALKKLMERGAYGTPLSCVPCRSGTAIPSIYTGVNPGKWGLFDFPSSDCDVVNYQKIKEKHQSVWDILGKRGYQSAIINIPTTHPPTETRGVMISGFSLSERDEYTYPRDFKKKVSGFHSARETLLKLMTGGMAVEKEEDLLDIYIRNTKKRYGLIRDVIKDKAFDFVIFWIDESDAAHHWFLRNEKFLLIFFKEIDHILGDIIENNQEANIIIMSDHGFAAAATHEFYPKSWLRQESYLKLKGGKIQQWLIQIINTLAIRVPIQYIRFFYSLYHKARKQNQKTNSSNHSWRPMSKEQEKSKVIGVDWQKTVASNHEFWGIKIFREKLDRDYEEVREEIMGKMRRLTDKKNGKIIKDVWKREEIFSGNDLLKFPDIVYLPVSKFEPTGYLPFAIAQKKKKPPKVPGEHLAVREGIFIAAGPNINQIGEIGEINILDVAPTVLQIFRVPVSKDMDGRVLKEILK